MKVLIAEDSNAMRGIVREMMRRLGYKKLSRPKTAYRLGSNCVKALSTYCLPIGICPGCQDSSC